jgi:alkylhydroperoxidase family enzyme
MNNTEPFLPPVEKPRGAMMKLLYRMSRKQFGKVMTPMKVFGARMPFSFSRMGGRVYQLDRKLALPSELVYLVRHQVARINVCEFCMDIGRYKAMRELMAEEKFREISDYRASALFTAAEKAALDYATELTRDKRVSPETFSALAGYYSPAQVCGIVYLVASEHLSNITNIGLNIHSDMFCDMQARARSQRQQYQLL